jgi:hypothetical protein
MKRTILPAFGALIALGLGAPSHAAGKPTTIFSCAIGQKIASVTLADGQLTYHYGTGTHDELTIVGNPAADNVFQMAQRYAGMEYQLRFVNDGYSYILYAAEGNPQVGAAAVSGLVVTQGTDRIADKACKAFAEFAVPLDGLGIAEDTEAYSAM